MKVIKTEIVKTECPIPLYDIRNTLRHNFILGTNSNEEIVSHNCALLDECNFGSHPKNLPESQSQIMRIYTETKTRQKSRFTRAGGKLPTMMFLISSKKNELDFLDRYIQKVKGDPNTYIVDKPVWEVRPRELFSKTTFRVGVGNRNLESVIIPDDEDSDIYIKQGYEIIDVPDNFRDDFEKDIDRALMAIAGISLMSALKFISVKRYDATVIDKKVRSNPFTSNILTIGLDDDLQIKDFFRPKKIPKSILSKPIYLHIDTSLKGDITGISAVSIKGAEQYTETEWEHWSKLARVNEDDEDEATRLIELHYNHIFTVGIKAPKNSEISLEKTRQFIYYLSSLGWNIKGISVDGFQSADTRQQLITKGYNCEVRSLDRTPDGYITFRAALNERRVETLDIPELRAEAIDVERNSSTGKIDHTPEGSKDLLDSYVGAIWFASTNKSGYVHDYGTDIDNAMVINTTGLDPRTQMRTILNKSLSDTPPEKIPEIQEAVRRMIEKYQQERKVIDVTDMDDSAIDEYSKQILEQPEPDVYKPTSLIDDGIIVF